MRLSASSALPRRIGVALVASVVAVQLGIGGVAWASKGGEPGPNQSNFDPASDTENNHCYIDENHDWNAIFGVSEALVTRFCREVNTGEWWIRPQLWFVATSNESFPEGYTPAGATPIEDFAMKLEAVKYVVDPGTRQERTHTFSGPQVLRTDLTAGDIEDDAFISPETPLALTLAKANPLSPGDHLVRTYMTLSAEHCDGLGDVREENCLPAGEFLFVPGRPHVTPGASQRG